jgi:hypothetical protein
VTGAGAARAGAGGATAGAGGAVAVVAGAVVAGGVVAVADREAGTRWWERARALALAADRVGCREPESVGACSGADVAGRRGCPGNVFAAAAAKEAVSSTAIVVTACLATLNRRSARSLARER